MLFTFHSFLFADQFSLIQTRKEHEMRATQSNRCEKLANAPDQRPQMSGRVALQCEPMVSNPLGHPMREKLNCVHGKKMLNYNRALINLIDKRKPNITVMSYNTADLLISCTL